jgi:mannose/fructose/N-acetylgalactosamine-specific phosphotransferase system component IIC
LSLWSVAWISALGSEGLRQFRRVQGYVVTRTPLISAVLYGVGLLAGSVGLGLAAGGLVGLSFLGVNLLGIGAVAGVQFADVP